MGAYATALDHNRLNLNSTFLPQGALFSFEDYKMAKHSKNNTASSIFSYAEYKKLDYGTKRVCVYYDASSDCHVNLLVLPFYICSNDWAANLCAISMPVRCACKRLVSP